MFARKTCLLMLLCASLNAITARWAEAQNRLGKESSPYLRMHSKNPVHWFPWGPEALTKAKKENKVIFLSVGYSSCYWCHVMERESFEDEEIAEFLNENFVCVKVDREERPDLDAIYMLSVQLVTGRGGWPMSVFLTPDARPFFGGTYFPARDGDRPGATGFLTLARNIQQVWKTKEADLRKSADQLTEAVRQNIDLQPDPGQTNPAKLDPQIIAGVQAALEQEFDPRYGGFGFDPGQPARPKFPEPSNLLFLLHQARGGDEKAREMVEVSLQKMHSGGIWDHIGGGFHRYSVDRFWYIPHFEKMLYDNGQLAVIYTQAFELTKKPEYQRVVERTLDWALREMRDRQGAFYSALDAESEKIEGKFYRWELPEAKATLGDDYATYEKIYGFDRDPNFEHEFFVPQLAKPLAEAGAAISLSEAELWRSLEPLHAKMLSVRNQRPRPLTDTKILTSWNGLFIRGLADAGRVFNRPDYTTAAANAANFVLSQMRTPEGRLFRTHTNGESKLNAYLDDYAFLCDGLIALHRATGDAKWLQQATELTELQIKLYFDARQGGFYFTSNDHEALIARGKQPSDGAQPAGNSVAVQNLIYLAKNAGNQAFDKAAQATLKAAAPLMEKSPRIAPRMALALAEWLESRTDTQ